MTTLLPDRATARRTRIAVRAEAGARARVRTTTTGDPGRPGLRPMLIESGPGRARVSLVPDAALLLAGDAVALDVEVGPGARLDLVEPGGTVAYDMRGSHALWDVTLNVAAGGVLTWAGEPFVLSAGSRVERTTTLQVDPDARVAIRETLVLGRHQERPGELAQRWRALAPDGEDLLVEELVLGGAAHRPGILGGSRVLGSVTWFGPAPEDDLCPEGRLDLEYGGTVWRRFGAAAHQAVPEEAWRAVLGRC